MKHIIHLLLGLCLGSFFYVVVSRDDWYKGRSRCDACGHLLHCFELIPVFSFLCLRGRCRHCKARIAPSHIISELLMGAGYLIVSFSGFPVLEKTIAYIAVTALGFNAISDWKDGLTYTWVSYLALAVVGLIRLTTWDGFAVNLIFTAMFGVMCCLLSLIASKYVGAGDLDIIFLLFFCCRAYAVILFLSLLITSLLFFLNSKQPAAENKVAFVPYLYLGYLGSVIVTGGVVL